MASIHKQPRRAYWFASYRDALGKQHFISTKLQHTPPGENAKERAERAAKNRRIALETAVRLEEAERGNATESHLRKVLADVSERVNRRRIDFKTVEVYLGDWLARSRSTKSPGTYERYRNVVQKFQETLGTKSKAKLTDVTVQDVERFIQERLEGGRNPSTVRTDCKILNAPFALALRQGLTLSNPVAAADIPEGVKESRSPFSAEQVTDLLNACDRQVKKDADNAAIWREWRTCILLGFYTGVRLGDAVAVDLGAFDFERHVLRVRPQKTSRKKRDLVIPLHPQLEAHILDLPIQDNEGVLCPALARRKVSGKYGLSIQFQTILAEAGVEQQIVMAAGKAGHKFRKFTFHSLRHSFVSELANAGIAPDVRQLLAGHSEERSHAVYTHTTLETLRKAVSALPEL